MAYNKAKAERKWLCWKEAEEKKLRALGVEEDAIQTLRQYDWEVFKSDRRYWEKVSEDYSTLELLVAEEEQADITTVEKLLDNIDSPDLHEALLLVDRLTLQIALWRMEGYKSKEISDMCGLSVGAVNFRMWYLRKKLKKILKGANT